MIENRYYKDLTGMVGWMIGFLIVVIALTLMFLKPAVACSHPEQEQEQQQQQGQFQGQGQFQTNDLSQSINSEDKIRLNHGPAHYQELIPYHGPINPGYRYRSVESILLYGNRFSIRELQKGVTDRMLRDNNLIRVTNEQALDMEMTVIYAHTLKDRKPFLERHWDLKRLGYVSGLSKGGATSVTAFRIMMLAANNLGAQIVHVTSQGVNPVISASGWGISLPFTGGRVSSSGDSGVVVSPGTGYQKSETGPNPDPWIQGIALEPIVQ